MLKLEFFMETSLQFYQRICTISDLIIKISQKLADSFCPSKIADLVLASPKQRTYKANPAGENSSLIFTVCVRSVPRYHFKLAYLIPQMAVKEFFETDF